MIESNQKNSEDINLDKETRFQKNIFTFISKLVSDVGVTQRAIMEGIPLSNKPVQNVLNVVHRKTGKVLEPKFSTVSKMVHYLRLSFTALELYENPDAINDLIKHDVIKVRNGLIERPNDYHFRLMAYLKTKYSNSKK